MKRFLVISVILLTLFATTFSSVRAQSYKILVTDVEYQFDPTTNSSERLGTLKVTVYYQNISPDGITSGWQIGEFLSYNPAVNGSETPLGVVSTSPIYLPTSNSTGHISFQLQDGRLVAGGHFKAWVFLWNQMPSDQTGTPWEAYCPRIEIVI